MSLLPTSDLLEVGKELIDICLVHASYLLLPTSDLLEVGKELIDLFLVHASYLLLPTSDLLEVVEELVDLFLGGLHAELSHSLWEQVGSRK